MKSVGRGRQSDPDNLTWHWIANWRLRESMGVVRKIRVPFGVPSRVRHPYKKDPEREPNLENYPCMSVLKSLWPYA